MKNPSVEDLTYLKSLRDAPGGRLPLPQDHITMQRVKALQQKGFVRVIQRSLLELGEDCVEITVAGRDAVSAWERSLDAENKELERLRQKAEKESAQSAKQDASERRAARRSWWQFWLGLLMGWILGGFTAREAFTWLAALFQGSAPPVG